MSLKSCTIIPMTSFIHQLQENDIFEADTDFGSYAYAGCVGASNGCIYGILCDATRVVEYNPATKTTRVVGDVLDSGETKWFKWWGGALGSDGCVYASPSYADRILRYDPATQRSTLVGDPLKGNRKYEYAVSVPEYQSIFFIPFNASRILCYSIIDGTTSYVGDTFDGNCKWKAACLSKVDGCIYCVPYHKSQVLKFNSVDGSTMLIGEEYEGRAKWSGCVEAPDGTIYCSPYNAANFLKIDVRAGTTSLIGQVQQPRYGGNWDGCFSCVIHDHMYICMLPSNSDRLAMFDTTNESFHEVGFGIRGTYLLPAISSFDGCAYAIPHMKSKSILKIDLSQMQSLHRAIHVKGISWSILKSIAEKNTQALEQGDNETALLPFMIAAESRDDNDEEASLASLTLVYQLLSMQPAVLKDYESSRQLRTRLRTKSFSEEKRRRVS